MLLLLAALASPAHAACDGERWQVFEDAFVHGRVVAAGAASARPGGRRCMERVKKDVLLRGIVALPEGDPRRPQDATTVLHGFVARAARLHADCGEQWAVDALAAALAGPGDSEGAVPAGGAEVLATLQHHELRAAACTELAVFTVLDGEGWYRPAAEHARRRTELAARAARLLQGEPVDQAVEAP